MRTRSRRDTSLNGDLLYHREGRSSFDGSLVVEADGSVYPAGAFVSGDSEITDELGYAYSQSCSHKSRLLRIDDALIKCSGFGHFGLDWTDTVTGPATAWLARLGGLSDGISVEHPSTDLGELRRKLHSSIREPKNSFFGIEAAKDLFHLYRDLRTVRVSSVLRDAKNILKDFGIARRTPLGSIRQLLGRSANGHLAWSFGFRPMVSDVKAVSSYSSDFLNRVAPRRKAHVVQVPPKVVGFTRKGKPIYSRGKHTKTVIEDTSTYRSSDRSSISDFPEPLLDTHTTCLLYQGIVSERLTTLSARVSEASPSNESFVGYVGRALRLGNILGLAWELIPFSFVADWFLHVDDRISTLESVLFTGDTRVQGIGRYCLTVREATSYKLFINYNGLPGLYGPSTTSKTYLGVGFTRRFRRNFFDDIEGSSLFTGISVPKMISASLLWQQLAKYAK